MPDQGDRTTRMGPEDALSELARRTAMLDAVSYVATRIVAGSDWRAGIQELLERLGHATSVSRVSLFEIHRDDNQRLVESCRYDWTEAGRPAMSSDPRYCDMPLVDEHGVIDEWTQRRRRGDVVEARVGALPGYNRQVFEETETLSFISVPIMLRSGCWGFLGFDDCHAERACTALEIDVLTKAAALIAGAIERAEADERLRLSEQRYALAARGANDGLWDWDVADDRAYFSPRLHQLLGLRDGAFGHRMSTFPDAFDAEDAERVRDYFRAHFAKQKRRFRFEARLREPATDRRWFVGRGMIVYADGQPARVVGSLRDITGVKRAEAKVRTLSNDAPVLLCMIDADDRLVFANRGFLAFFGRTLEDLAGGGWDWTADIHPDDLARTRQRYFEALQRHETIELEHPVRRFDRE